MILSRQQPTNLCCPVKPVYVLGITKDVNNGPSAFDLFMSYPNVKPLATLSEHDMDFPKRIAFVASCPARLPSLAALHNPHS